MTDTLTVTDPAAIRYVTDPKKYPYLLTLMTAEKTLAEVAEALGVRLNTATHHLNRLTALGLARVSGSRPYNGRALTLYRATAAEFFVPFEATSHATLESLIRQTFSRDSETRFCTAFARLCLRHKPAWGVRIVRGANGLPIIIISSPEFTNYHRVEHPSPHGPAVVIRDCQVQLDQETAKALEHDPITLFNRYMGKRSESGEDYLLTLRMLPAQAVSATSASQRGS